MIKRIIIILLLCAFLFGCSEEAVTQPTTASVTEETVIAQPWGENLKHLPISVLETESDLSFGILEDRIILWQYEYGVDWIGGLKLWSVDLLSGNVLAETEIDIEYYLQPQLQDDRICICDSGTGDIMVLDRDLQIVKQWHREPDWNHWVMGKENLLYRVETETLVSEDLETGNTETVFDRVANMTVSNITPQGISLSYSDVDLGAWQVAFFDFSEGLLRQPFRGRFERAQYTNGQWLCVKYADQREFRVGNETLAMDGKIEEGLISLLPEGYLCEETSESLYLYDLQGQLQFGCNHNPNGEYVSGVQLRWCETLGGYLFTVWDECLGRRVMVLWELNSTIEHENLSMTQVDLSVTPEAELAQLRQRAETLGEAYDVKIWIADDCDTDFDDYSAELLTDTELIAKQLDVLESVLSIYPQGFFKQLRYGTYQQIHIQIVSSLVGKSDKGNGTKYNGFTQPKDGYYLMVVDADNDDIRYTYYHEFSHIIDEYLAWRNGLFSEEQWISINPSDFEYTYDYTDRQELTPELADYFIDDYAMTNPTEDRARILEYGMREDSGWLFGAKSGAMEKLQYYCRCIRDAFDTSGWADKLLWEQYLP